MLLVLNSHYLDQKSLVHNQIRLGTRLESIPRGTTLVRLVLAKNFCKAIKNPYVKRKDCLTPVSLCRERETGISDSQRPDNGGVSGGTYLMQQIN